MDWKALGNVAALVGVLVAMAVMFNQVNGRLDRQESTDSRSLQDQPFALLCIPTRCRFHQVFILSGLIR